MFFSYRLEHIYDKNLENTNRNNAYYEAQYRIADCIKYHTKILELVSMWLGFIEKNESSVDFSYYMKTHRLIDCIINEYI